MIYRIGSMSAQSPRLTDETLVSENKLPLERSRAFLCLKLFRVFYLLDGLCELSAGKFSDMACMHEFHAPAFWRVLWEIRFVFTHGTSEAQATEGAL